VLFPPAARLLDDRRLAWALLALAAGLFVSQCLVAGDALVDDAFFTFSFARNLAQGHGPVYSHGVRVEGYSAFLWMLVLALPLALAPAAAPVTVARVAGAPFVVLLGWATYRLARLAGASRAASAACVLLLAFNTDLAVAYLTGMETIAFVALLAAAFAAALASLERPDARWSLAAPYLAVAVALTRIDGFISCAFLAGMGLLAALSRRAIEHPARRLVRGWAVPVSLYAAWFLWRWWYYGLPLPSPYYAKALIPVLLPRRGLEYVADELTGGGLWLGLLALLWLLWRQRLAAALLGGFALLHLVYVVQVGGDWMPFGRFVLPVVPLLVVLVGVAVEELIGRAARARWWLRPTIVLPLAAAAGMATAMDHRFLNGIIERSKLAGVTEQKKNVRSYVEAASFLREVVPPGGRLVTDYGGVLAVYTDGALIEMWGLANSAIATRGNTERVNAIYGKTCAACYPALDPEFFHVGMPIVRPEPAFTSAAEVIAAVWQSEAIGRYLDFQKSFVVGRVASGEKALYFLQKRAPGMSLAERRTANGFVVSYPFSSAASAGP
jgi:arabinofuranosyltransferase